MTGEDMDKFNLIFLIEKDVMIVMAHDQSTTDSNHEGKNQFLETKTRLITEPSLQELN